MNKKILIFFLVAILICSFYGSMVYGYSEGLSSPQNVKWKYSVENMTDLVLGLHLDEGTGTIAYDYSEEGNNSTIYGASWVNGKYGKALSFDGDDYAEVNHNSVLAPMEGSVAFWAKPSTTFPTVGPTYLVDKDLNNLGLYGFFFHDYGQVFFYLNGTTYCVTSDTAGQQNVWMYVVGTWKENDYMRIYINGVLESSPLAIGALSDSSKPLDFGKRSGMSSNFLNGVIDEVQVYSRALNQTEITSLYENNFVSKYISGNSSSSAYYWSLENKQNFKYDFSYAFPSETLQRSLNCTYPKTQAFVNVSFYPFSTKLGLSQYSLFSYNSTHNLVSVSEDTIALYGNNYRIFTEVKEELIPYGFIFLTIILLLQVLAIFIKIPIIHLLFGLFGMVLSLTIQSEIAYPIYNIFVIFACLISMFYLERYRSK